MEITNVNNIPFNAILSDQEILATLFNILNLSWYAVDKNGKVLVWNKVLTNIVEQMFPDRDLTELHVAEIDNDAWQNLQHVMLTKQTEVIKEQAPNGRWYLSVKSPLVVQNKIEGVIGIALDITEREKIEQEKLNAIFSIGASIAHELRTPLATISACSSSAKRYLPILIHGYELAKKEGLAIEWIPSFKYQTLFSSLDVINKEVNYANIMIDMLLMKSKQSNVNDAEIETLSMLTCIHESINRYPFASEQQKKKIKLPKESDFKFRGNHIFMMHVFFNLLKNSLYYIHSMDNGMISIRLEKGANANRLYFRDNGKGIPKELLTDIFQRYFSKTHNGTGLGLAFCKMVIEGFGGKISCNSIEQEFTEFTLEFPKI